MYEFRACAYLSVGVIICCMRNPAYDMVRGVMRWDICIGECSGLEWIAVERSGVEWSEVEWSGVEWSGVEWSGVEWCGVEWSGVEWRGPARSAPELSFLGFRGVEMSCADRTCAVA